MNNHTEALELFRLGPGILEEALRGITEEEASFVPAPGKWTIRQVMRHVADTEIVVAMRMRQIIAEEKPTLIPFDQNLWAANLGYEKTGVAKALASFRSLRDDTSALLEALPAHAFGRVGVHPERGAKSLLEWVSLFGGHVAVHAKQIRDIRNTVQKNS